MVMVMHVAADGDSAEIGGTFFTGEVDGERSSVTMDYGVIYDDLADQLPAGEALPDSFLDDDLTMEAVTDGTTLYLRAPYFEATRDLALLNGATPSDLGPLNDLTIISGQWGRVELSDLSFSEIASAAGAQASDPRAMLDMAARGTDVRDLGAETIDGVETRGLGAVVTYGDVIEAQGMDADAVRDEIAGAMQGEGDNDLVDDIVEGMFAADMPVEVWVDGDDRVRRIALDLDLTEAFENIGVGGLSTDMVMDFADYGEESIEIEMPSDAVDITDEYAALIQGGGLGVGGSATGA